jgi:hypothetical protein
MTPTAWIITGVSFLVILTVGTWRFWRPLFKGAQYWSGPNSSEISASWLREHIRNAKKSVEAVTGNLNPYVFDGVAEIIETRIRDSKNLEIKILVGPDIIVLESGNKLLELSQRLGPNRFQLAFLDKRPEQHFRVVDEIHLYVELPHPPGACDRMAETWENAPFKGWKYHIEFQELWKGRVQGAEPRLIPIEEIKQVTQGGDSCHS